MPEIVLNPAVETAFSKFVNILQTAVTDLRNAFIAAGYTTVEEARPQAMALMSKKYGIAIVESKSPFNKGEPVFDRSSPNFATAKQALIRLMGALAGADAKAEASASETTKAEKYEIPEELGVLAARLVAACREYDGMTAKEQKSLAAQAVAQAFKAK